MGLCTATFETGTNGNTIASGDAGSATAWDSVVGSPTYDNAHVYQTLSAKFAAVGRQLIWSTAYGTQAEDSQHYGRMYLYATGFPSDFWTTIRVMQGAGHGPEIWINSTGKILSSIVGSSATSATSIATNQWVRIEYHILQSLTVGYCEIKLFNNPDSTVETELFSSGLGNSRATTDSIQFGLDVGVSDNGPIWMDNLVAGAPSWPGPFVVPTPGNLAPVIYGRGAC